VQTNVSTWPHPVACRPWRSCATQWVRRGGRDVAAIYIAADVPCSAPYRVHCEAGYIYIYSRISPVIVISRRPPLETQDNASWNHESIDCSSLAPGPAQLGKAHWGSRFLVAGLYWSTLTDPPACARVWASRRSDIAAFRLHTALLTTTWLVVDWLILTDLLSDLDIDSSWSTDDAPRALRPAASALGPIWPALCGLIYLSGNRYFPFLYGRWYSPHQVQGSRIQYGLFVLDPRLPPGVRCLGAILPFCCWNVALPLPRCGTSPWSKVHGRDQNPVRSVISFCTRHLHSAI